MKPWGLQLLILSGLIGCQQEDDTLSGDSLDYKQEMREFVISISQRAKSRHPGFLIIPQNGIELVTENGEEDGPPASAYLAAIDANGQEDLFYGYNEDDQPTPTEDNQYLRSLLDISRAAGNTILVTDYCTTPQHMDDSYAKNAAEQYVSFAADHRELDHIPAYPLPIPGQNTQTITALNEVQNFLYLINPEGYSSKTDFIRAVTATDYDLIIMDLFFHDGSAFTAEEVAQLRQKSQGGERLVVAYMSIGEAEDYRYYWQADWAASPPDWMEAENPDWEDNYKVRYWQADWQQLILGDEDGYLGKILDAQFDGVYLDIIDAFEYFE